ncbi:MAG TPA: YafY family protein [Acidimicrobiales bacterium]|nr:YafY family protein [Acidimicrobiales bacterium]
MQSSSARLLELLSLLQTRPHWNAAELAERLGITERTVRRDVTRLRELGYPVVADAGRAGGYQLGRGGVLPPLLLTDDESVAVAIGLRVAASGGVAGYDEAAVAALAKLEQMLPAPLRERVLALNAATVLPRTAGPVVDPDVLLTIAQACRRSERIRFGYRDGAGNVSERRAEPYDLVNADRRWYLVARDLDRQDWRTFRLDRMSGPALTGHRFVRSEEPDAAAMVAHGVAVAPYRWQAEVVARATVAEVAAAISPTVGTVEEVGGEVVIHIGANEVDWLAGYLAGLPFDFEVRSPREARAAVRALGRRLQRSNPARRAGPGAPS